MKSKKLTFGESLMLVAGAGIGTGILTIPYAVSKIGLFGTLLSLFFAYLASALMYLMIADLTRNSKKPEDLLAILDEHLFSGKGKKALNIAFSFCSFCFCSKIWWYIFSARAVCFLIFSAYRARLCRRYSILSRRRWSSSG